MVIKDLNLKERRKAMQVEKPEDLIKEAIKSVIERLAPEEGSLYLSYLLQGGEPVSI